MFRCLYEKLNLCDLSLSLAKRTSFYQDSAVLGAILVDVFEPYRCLPHDFVIARHEADGYNNLNLLLDYLWRTRYLFLILKELFYVASVSLLITF